MSSEQKQRPVNQTLGMQPRFGPFPADQLVPWLVIGFTCYFLLHGLLQLSWLWVILAIGWGCSTWWLLTGSKSWKFLSKFLNPPTWSRGRVRYRSFLVFIEQSQATRTTGKGTQRVAKQSSRRRA